jgi:uncharacterized protein (DUF1697 family)
MAVYAAFLRGVNLGKRRRVTNERLRSAFEDLGLEGVATFRASGNVVFEAPRGPAGRIGARVEAGLAVALGFEVVVFLRSGRQVRAIAKRRPFDEAALASSAGRAQVALLAGPPAGAARGRALALAGGEDRLAIEGSELYWLPRGGISDSGLDLSALESLIGPWTMRTMGTIEQLAARYCAG